jgi:viroplasmin and RNaseH domain-containing protein
MKWYIMYKGKIPCVYSEWKDYQKQVKGFSGNNYKECKTKEEAEASYLEHLACERRNQMMETSVIPFVLIMTAFLVYVLVV